MLARAQDIDLTGVGGLLLDLDGTLHNKGSATPGAVELIDYCRAIKLPFVFCTQDAEHGEGAILQRLREAGIDAREDEIVTGGSLVAPQIRERCGDGPVETIATAHQLAHLRARGLRIAEPGETPVAVMLGLYGGFAAADLERACRAVWGGAKLFTLAFDRAFPTGAGLIPGIGAFAKAVEHVTGVRALCIGKPSRAFANAALARLKVKAANALVVGDTLDADIRMGRSIGARTLAVLTGSTSREDVRRAAPNSRPDWLTADVSVLLAALQGKAD